MAAERQDRADHAMVIAIDGPSLAGKSILATAVALRSEVAVLEGDDFYRHTLPRVDRRAAEAMSDATSGRCRDRLGTASRPSAAALASRAAGRVQPYDWDADDGRLAPPKTIPAADLVIVEGVYAARPELAHLGDVAVYLGVDRGYVPSGTPSARTIRTGGVSGSAARPTISASSDRGGVRHSAGRSRFTQRR